MPELAARKLGAQRFNKLVALAREAIRTHAPQVAFESAHEAVAAIPLPKILALVLST